MNETSQSPQSGGFFQWIRNLGIVRDSGDRWFAGVASGIARKTRVDPLIVRGIFVVLALVGGPGLLLYLFGWLFLPDMTGKIHAEELMRGRSTPGVIIGAIVVAVWVIAGIAVPWQPVFWPWDFWQFSGSSTVATLFAWAFWIAVIAVTVYLVHRAIVQRGAAHRDRAHHETPEPGQPQHDAAYAPQADPHPAQAPTTAFTTAAFTTSTSGETTLPATTPLPDTLVQHEALSAGEGSKHDEDQTRTRPLGDQAADEPFSQKAEAWAKDFSDKADAWSKDFTEKTDAWSADYAEKYERTRLSRGHLIITLALALLAAGASALWALGTDLTVDTMLPRAAAPVAVALIAATTVLALSMIIAGARGRCSGTIGFLGFLGVLAIIVSLTVPWGSRFYLFGDQQITHASPGVVAVAGTMELDLGHYDGDRLPDDELVVTQMFGNVDVTVPEERPTQVTVRLGAGQVHLTEHPWTGERSGTEVTSGVFTNRTFELNRDAEGDPLIVTVNVGAGNVTLFDTDTAPSRTTSLTAWETTR